MTWKVKDLDFADEFEADTEKEAAMEALKMLHFSFGSKKDIEEHGAIEVLKNLGYELEIVK